MKLPLMGSKKSLSELEEEDETATVELSIAQKRTAIARLKENGLTPKHFGNPPDWRRIWNWLKAH